MIQYYKHKLAFIAVEEYQFGMEDGFDKWSTSSCNEITYIWLKWNKKNKSILLESDFIKIPYKIINNCKEYIYPKSKFIYTQDNRLLVYSPDKFINEFTQIAELDINIINQLNTSYQILTSDITRRYCL